MNATLSPFRVLVKAFSLFVIINIIYALINPQLFQFSAYNILFPGRTRLPFGISGDPYTVSVDDVDAMFASHVISASKSPKEYRVALVGDSSIWGENLSAHEVISEQWNQWKVPCGDKRVRAYDLGFPHPSVIKDLVILDKVVEYKPDLIIWFVTLNTLTSQRLNPFLAANSGRLNRVLTSYDISFKPGQKSVEHQPDFFEKTVVGQRSNLARWIKLQMLGIIWTATGADRNISTKERLPDQKIDDDPRYHGVQTPADLTNTLLFAALIAGQNMVKPVPILIVNEPMFIAEGPSGVVRYNLPYPRWAYDEYRDAMASQAQKAQWNYLDLWNAIPPRYFSDAGLHLSASGERLLIEQLNPALQAMGCDQKP